MRGLSFALGAFLSVRLCADATIVDQDFASATVLYQVAGNYEQSGAPKLGLKDYDRCYGQLQQIRASNPNWNPGQVMKQMADCSKKIDAIILQLNNRAGFARGISNSPFLVFCPNVHPTASITTSYPWRRDISATVFILGEKSDAASLDPHWVRDNGGTDTATGMSGYASDSHASTMNPFYVGLPFNDVAHPALAMRWLPRGWTTPKSEPHGSACLGRWVELLNRNGRSCFAQWEAADPAGADDAAYVFGSSATPKEAAGIHVSPAVAKYLGFEGTAVASWRFVDDDDVPAGLWLRYSEQAVLFSALRETTAGAAAPAAAQAH